MRFGSGNYGETNVVTNNNGIDYYSGFTDPSTRTVVVNASNPSSQLLSSDGKVDSSSFPTATVGEANPFTYQVQALLDAPYNDRYGYPELIQVMNGNGEEILQDASDIEVAGIPLTELEGYGASVSYNDSYGAYDSQASGSAAALSLTLPSKALSFIASNGYLPATSSMPVGSSPLDGSRALSVTFKAYLSPAQGKAEAPEWAMGMDEFESSVPSSSQISLARRPSPKSNLSSSDALITEGPSLSLPEVYTNGPSDDSLPSSLSASDPSSATGLWFENTFENPKDNNKGCSIADSDSYSPTEFTVQNPSGQYLTPVEDDGTFEGWEWSGSPYDFKERNSSGDFEWGGLADGTYTVKSVEYPSSLSFTSSLSYSSPQILEGKGTASVTWGHPEARGGAWSFNWYISGGYLDYSDIQGEETDWSGPPPLPTSNLTGKAGYACYINPGGPTPAPAPSAPSRLPFTGGKGVLGLSLASSFLFLLGAGVWWGLKKKRGSHASLDDSPKKHGF